MEASPSHPSSMRNAFLTWLKTNRLPDILFIVLLVAISGFYFGGIPQVPFHPDESTQLFMSSDVDRILTDPAELFYVPGTPIDLHQHYRLIDAPLTRYIAGAGRFLAGLKALPTDWDWSQDWTRNSKAGALPQNSLLFSGRLAVALLFPLSLYFLYRSGVELGSPYLGLLFVLLSSTNALLLVHTRRAMAEGALFFCITLFIFGLIHSKTRVWLIALSAALAFCAKQSAAALIPVGLIAVCWSAATEQRRFRAILKNILLYSSIILIVGGLLNPFLWAHPVQAIQAAWIGRQELLTQQVDTLRKVAPEQILDSPDKRVLAMLAQIYILPPSFEEVGNYTLQISSQAENYLQIPGTALFRGILWGGIFFTLTLFGLCVSGLRMRGLIPRQKIQFSLLFIATAAQVITILITVPFGYQRYYVPIIPWVVMWISITLWFWISNIQKIVQKKYLLHKSISTS